PPVAVLQQIAKIVVGQAITLGIAVDRAVRPTTIESARRCQPKRSFPVVQQISDLAMLLRVSRHPYVDVSQPQSAFRLFQPSQSFLCPAQDRSLTAFQ